MGITISSKRFSCDMGYGGFGRFRDIVAKQLNNEFSEHYLETSMPNVMFLSGEKRDEYFKIYNAKTERLVDIGLVTDALANFLFQPDCDGSIDRKQAKQVYELIKDCDDNIAFGYIGRKDCAKMLDMKNIFSDGTKVKWH